MKNGKRKIEYLWKGLLCLAAVALTLVLTQCGKTERQKTLTVGVATTMPPYDFFQNGEIVGIEIDVVREIAEKNGYAVLLKEMPFVSIIDSVNNGTCDVGSGVISITDLRREKVDFTIPYDTMPRVIMVSKKSPLQSFSQLKERKFNIGIHEGTTKKCYELLKDHNVFEFKNYGLAVAAMLYGSIDGVLVDHCVGEEYAEVNTDIIFFPEPLFVDELGIAVRKDRQDVLQMLNKGIEEMAKSGRLQDLKHKYHAPARKIDDGQIIE